MARLPRVLIVGRPNVGKSTLVNRILKKKRAITLDEPGVTRDISTHEVVWRGKPFVLMDSGGVMFQNSSDFDFQESIDEIVLSTLETVDYIIFLVDSRDGVHPLDKEVGKKLQPYKDKVAVDSPSVTTTSLADPALNLSIPNNSSLLNPASVLKSLGMVRILRPPDG